jgi:hypothetical protein
MVGLHKNFSGKSFVHNRPYLHTNNKFNHIFGKAYYVKFGAGCKIRPILRFSYKCYLNFLDIKNRRFLGRNTKSILK